VTIFNYSSTEESHNSKFLHLLRCNPISESTDTRAFQELQIMGKMSLLRCSRHTRRNQFQMGENTLSKETKHIGISSNKNKH
jgi:hypothetical protein